MDEKRIHWHFKNWHWLLKNNGGITLFQHSNLIEANEDFFPKRGGPPHMQARCLFNLVRMYTGTIEWPYKLIKNPDDARRWAIYWDEELLENRYEFIHGLLLEMMRGFKSNQLLKGPKVNHDDLDQLITHFLGFGLFNLKYYEKTVNLHKWNKEDCLFSLAIFSCLHQHLFLERIINQLSPEEQQHFENNIKYIHENPELLIPMIQV